VPRADFVILSCDRYAPLWHLTVARLRRFWPELPFPLHLTTNELDFDDPEVTALKSGRDTSWSSSLRRSLEQLTREYVFLWFDDALLDAPVPHERIMGDTEWAMERGVSYLRFRSVPRPQERVTATVGRLAEAMPYRVTCQSALWRREVLLALLRDDENAAGFEMNGTLRAVAHSDFFGVYDPPFKIIHAVLRGAFLPSAIKRLTPGERNQVRGKMPVMSWRREWQLRLREWRAEVVTRLPPGFAHKIFGAKAWLTAGRWPG
jgi:hypothetical protein